MIIGYALQRSIFLTPYDDPMSLNRKIRFELVRDAEPGQAGTTWAALLIPQPTLDFYLFLFSSVVWLHLCLFIFFLSLPRLAVTAALLRLFGSCAAASLPVTFPIGETDGQGGDERYYCIQQVVSELRNDYNFPMLFSGASDLSEIPDLRELLSSSDSASDAFPSLGRCLTHIELIDGWKNIVRGGYCRFSGLISSQYFPFFQPIFFTPYDDLMGLNRKIRFELFRDARLGWAGPTQATRYD
ncbi:hypothetical protein M9H77_28344 [Catharanthus roseus]|uniref:Uncharacterized protein n=1 Tax=Catharanthus roseus TaxID=4058 RepID=A0ACC0AJ71_CATRO|nr:hypothetical protein M9H77_28344 [Catharanthus roseus]